MDKQIVKWKAILTKNVRGEDIDLRFPDLIDLEYRGTLVIRVLLMERKRPVSFEVAIRLARCEWNRAFNANRIGKGPGECLWYTAHFVEWISELGYHIELTGDEFESYSAIGTA